MPAQLFQSILLILLTILPLWVLYRLPVYKDLKRQGKKILNAKEWLLLISIVYLGLVIALTIVPVQISAFQNPKEPGLNFIPFINTYQHFLYTLASPDNTMTNFALENIFGNILLFIPAGILLPCIFPGYRNAWKTAATCFYFSLTIELIQLLLRQFGTYRTVDIDDIILNTLGGVIGFLLFTILNRLDIFPQNKDANTIA